MTKIAVILAYFGPLPATWPLTQQTMLKNDSIDWLIFTDQEVESGANLKVFKYSFAQFRDLISDKLGFSVAIDRPYKICDFRPAFGVIFDDYLNGYDFWGYCDADVIFGNLTNFVAQGVASGCDKIFQRGHLSLLRNVEHINTLFLKTTVTPSYKDVFSNPSNLLFDEGGAFYEMLATAGVETFEDDSLFDIIPTKFRPMARNSKILKPIYFYTGGRVFEYDTVSKETVREGRYMHIQKRPYSLQQELQSVEEFASDEVGLFGPGSIVKLPLGELRNVAINPIKAPFQYLRWIFLHLRRKQRNKALLSSIAAYIRKSVNFRKV